MIMRYQCALCGAADYPGLCECDTGALAVLLRDTRILVAPIASVEVLGIGLATLEPGAVRRAPSALAP